MRTERLTTGKAQLVAVDIQERLLPHIAAQAEVLGQALRMIRAATEMGLPILVSEQYPQGLGRTNEAVLAATQGAERIEKLTFSVCGDERGRQIIAGRGRSDVLLVGIETHVCVQQTALDLLAMGLRPVVLADAVGSRRRSDYEMALARMGEAGAIVTTVESAIYELLERAGTELFKRMLPIVK